MSRLVSCKRDTSLFSEESLKCLVWHMLRVRNQTCKDCCSTVCWHINGTVQHKICIDRSLDAYQRNIERSIVIIIRL